MTSTDVVQSVSGRPFVAPTFKVAELRVLLRSLSEESRIIRHEMGRELKRRRRSVSRNGRAELQKWHGQQYESLCEHRLKVVRPAYRVAHLAYAFLRGIPYREVEAKTRNGIPCADEIADLVVRFSALTPWTTAARKEFSAKVGIDVNAWILQATLEEAVS